MCALGREVLENLALMGPRLNVEEQVGRERSLLPARHRLVELSRIVGTEDGLVLPVLLERRCELLEDGSVVD